MQFDILKEVVLAISRNKIKEIEIPGNKTKKRSRLSELYEAILNETVTSDAEAVNYLFATDDIQNANYARLKGKLFHQLANMAFFVDVNQPFFNDRAKAYYQCYSHFAAGNILILRNARKSGVYLLEEVHKVANRYEFIDLCVESARVLRWVYGRSLNSPQLHKKYTSIYRSFLIKRDAELRAGDCLEELVQYYVKKMAPDYKIHELAVEYYNELFPQISEVKTATFCYSVHQIGVIQFLSINDCDNALKVCDQGLDMLDKMSNVGRDMRVGIASQKIACLTQLRRFDDNEAVKTIQYCLGLAEIGSFNWFRIQELHLQYCLHARQYEKALDIYILTQSNSKFVTLQGNILDHWHLFGGYFHLLAAFGKLNQSIVTESVGPFRYARFANEIEMANTDKSGLNLPLILLPFLFSLATDNALSAGASIESLEQYRKRHLKGRLHIRSSSFTNLLALLMRFPFEPVYPKHRIKSLWAALTTKNPQITNQTQPIEIIPYEDLWEMLTAPNK